MTKITFGKNRHSAGEIGGSKWTPMIFMLMMLAIALVPTIASAATTSNGPFAVHDNDYFVNMLLKGMLGPDINVNSASAQSTFSGDGTLGTVFRAFNLGVAFFGSIIIMFVSVVGIMNTGNDGEFLGKRWSSFWVPIRFGLGAAIMLPVTSAGYSFIQAMCLWIAGQGVYFADTVWDALVDKQAAVVNASNISAQTPTLPILSGIALSDVCKNYYNAKLIADVTSVVKNPVVYNDYWGNTAMVTNAYGQRTEYINWATLGEWATSLNAAEKLTLNTCGLLAFTHNVKIQDGFEGMRDAITKTHHDQITDAHNALDPLALTYVTKLFLSSDEAEKNAAAQALADKVVALNATYKAAIVKNVTDATDGTPAADALNLAPMMKDLGFASAGAFYIGLAKLHGIMRDGLQNVPKYAPPDLKKIAKVAGAEDWDIVSGDINKYLQGAVKSTTDKGQYSIPAPGAPLTVQQTAPSSDNLFDSLDKGMDWTDKISLKLVHALIGIDDEYNTIEIAINRTKSGIKDANGNTLPKLSASASLAEAYSHKLSRRSAILQFKDKGDIILDLAGAIQTSYIVANAIVAGANGGIAGLLGHFTLFNGFDVISKILESLMMMVLSLVLSLVTLGILLAVVIPMTPFMIWVMGIAGLLILIIESLVASVIWAVMIMHPSGEGITSDHSRQGLMILLMLFMRPALMVMGLASSIFMVDPLVDFMNDMFGFAFRSIQTEGFTGLFIVFGMCAVYTTMSVSLIKKCFSMIHLVPDRVLRWIGGGGESLGESEPSDRVDAMAGSAGGRAGGLSSSGSQPSRQQKQQFSNMVQDERKKNVFASQQRKGQVQGPPQR